MQWLTIQDIPHAIGHRCLT